MYCFAIFCTSLISLVVSVDVKHHVYLLYLLRRFDQSVWVKLRPFKSEITIAEWRFGETKRTSRPVAAYGISVPWYNSHPVEVLCTKITATTNQQTKTKRGEGGGGVKAHLLCTILLPGHNLRGHKLCCNKPPHSLPETHTCSLSLCLSLSLSLSLPQKVKSQKE